MKIKQFKTLDEQLEILKHKGLTINNEDYAKEVLLRENYFFLNGYRYLFLDEENKKFIKGTTFEEFYSLFLFDRQFRNVIFKHLLIIENNVKSIISYRLSKKYGYKENDYLRAKNFDTSSEKVRQVNDLIKKMKRQVMVNGRQHSATRHYISNYGYIPLWILVKVLSFGIVSELYSILRIDDRISIAEVYHLDLITLGNFLPILANYRNLCAHEDILYENRTHNIIKDTPYHTILNIKRDESGYLYGKNDLFALIIIMKHMLTDVEIKDMIIEIERLVDNLDYNLESISIDSVLERMGFPPNWKDIANIER